MLTEINPKLPMRDMSLTKAYYLNTLGFQKLSEYENYLIVRKDAIQIHFFLFNDLNPKENYGQVYIRTNDVDALYKEFVARNVAIHPNVKLETKPWGQREFSILDPDHNLLTFGQSVNELF